MAKRKRGKRTASGQLSRESSEVAKRIAEADRQQFEEGPMQTALKARRRQRREFTQPKPEACDEWREKVTAPVTKQQMKGQELQLRGSVLGKWAADKKITREQLAAGNDFCARYIEYAATNGLPRPTPQAASYGAVRGGSRPENIRRAVAAKQSFRSDEIVLHHCTSGVYWAMKRACILDENAPLHLVIEGLDALIANGR